MTVHLPRLRFSLDPLIAEAKRRMRRRRFLVAVAIAAVVGTAVGLTLALRSPGGPGQAAASFPSHPGFARIPGLTKIASSRPSLCSGFKEPPSYCQPGAPVFKTPGSEQVWALTPAVQKYGIHHVPLPIPLPLARRYPGPDYVVVDVFRLASMSVARRFLPIYSHTTGYTALPHAAINGGIAARIDSLANDGLREFRFAWVSGTSIAEVNVLGADMTVSEAKRAALLARPS